MLDQTDLKNKCSICGKEYDSKCDYRQGRCPHHPPMLTDYHFRFVNLIQSIKNLFRKKIK